MCPLIVSLSSYSLEPEPLNAFKYSALRNLFRNHTKSCLSNSAERRSMIKCDVELTQYHSQISPIRMGRGGGSSATRETHPSTATDFSCMIHVFVDLHRSLSTRSQLSIQRRSQTQAQASNLVITRHPPNQCTSGQTNS
jgi:hypothetical protein